MTDEIMTVDNGCTSIDDFVTRGNQYPRVCSFNPTNEKEQAVLFKAMNNPSHRLGEAINTVITVKDIFAEYVDVTNRETGEVNKAPRIVLIDNKGEGWACVSVGIMSAVKNLITIYGSPTWEDGIKVKVVQVIKGERRMLTLEPVF